MRMRIVALVLAVVHVVSVPVAMAQSQEGIKVHGRWIIEVRNVDGTLAVRHDFQNALTPFGGTALSFLIARAGVSPTWSVHLHGPDPVSGPCLTNGGQPFPCQIYEPGRGYADSSVSANLTVSLSPANALNPVNGVAVKTVLRGTATAGRNADITDVGTLMNLSYPGGTGMGYSFSQAKLPTIVKVVSGQIIQVTVEFSFS
jgi:hypothetical protein